MRAFSNTVSDLSGQDHYSLGRPIMGRLLNETLRAELGRSSWKLLHTMVARFPKDPKLEQKTMLKDYIYLFARLYPCGEWCVALSSPDLLCPTRRPRPPPYYPRN